MLDGDLGVWLAVDKLTSEYPSLSPYCFVAGNPLIFVDSDGKDYVIVIDNQKEQPTITILATVYSITKDKAEAESAALGWNAQSGKYQYIVSEGESIVSYDVNIQITVIDVGDDYNERDNTWFKDISGMSNTYMTAKLETIEGNSGIAEDAGNVNHGISQITVAEGKQKERSTGTHEMGHILGLKHMMKGVMKAGQVRKNNETEITIRYDLGNLETRCN